MQEKQDISIERVFLEKSGQHCLLSNDQGFNFYWNLEQNQITYMKEVSVKIKSVAWEDMIPFELEGIQKLIIGTDQGEIIIVNICKKSEKEYLVTRGGSFKINQKR